MKFGRIYTMFIQGRTSDHIVRFPLSCEFRVINNSLFSCGSAVFRITNLSADVRADLYKDPFEQLTYKQLVFSAGYEKEPSVPIIFQGNVLTAFSYRQGPDWITQIEALDGGFGVDNANINLTKPSPYEITDALADVVNAMKPYHLNPGKIGSFDIPNSRGITFSGNAWDVITQIIVPAQGQAFISKEVIHIVQQWEFIESEGLLDTINSDTGLIGTPRFQEAIVKARMIFEPRLEVAQQVQLQTLQTRMNGAYKVLSLIHAGLISGADCGTLETEATLYQPDRVMEAA